jgi:hypothetical protein
MPVERVKQTLQVIIPTLGTKNTMDGIFATTIVSGSRKSSSEYGAVTTVSLYSSHIAERSDPSAPCVIL